MPSIELREVTKTYGKREVLRGVDLSVEPGTFQVVFGPPACGKSVVVRLLTGLERPTSGGILLRGRDASRLSSAERDVGYVPQSFALYPHYSVEQNIAYPLDLMRLPRREIQPRVQRVAERLRIQHLLRKTPNQLSGGEKQRVALARGIVKPTDLFVLDDPLVGLDFKLREQLFDDLKQMQRDLRATFVFMTSDPFEALALADRVAILDQGRILEDGPIEALCQRPRHVRTLELLGAPASNRLAGVLRASGGALRLDAGIVQCGVRLDPGAAPPADGAVAVGIRPQHLALGGHDDAGLLRLSAEVFMKEDLGAEEIVYLRAGGLQLVTVVPHAARADRSEGPVTVGLRPADVAIFSAETGLRLGQGAASHG